MIPSDSYQYVLEKLVANSSSRDPRILRLASVTNAILEVANENKSASNVYASAVKALEATLIASEADQSVDSFLTQCSLLELLSVTFPHVPKLMLKSTIPAVSRVLRAVVISCQAAHNILETTDDLSMLISVLKAICRCSAELIRVLPPQSSSEDVSILFRGTILTLFENPKRRVYQAAHDSVCDLLMMTAPNCHATVKIDVARYVFSRLKVKDEKLLESNQEYLNLLDFLQRSAIFIDPIKIGTQLMERLTRIIPDPTFMTEQASFISATRQEGRARLTTVNAILTTVKEIVGTGGSNSDLDQLLGGFSSRVLATLVQMRAGFGFQSGNHEDALSVKCRILHGEAVLATFRRLLQHGDSTTGCKLLPLTLQLIVKLMFSNYDSQSDVQVAETLSAGLVELFRTDIKTLRIQVPNLYQEQIPNCAQVMETVLTSDFQHTWSASLSVVSIFVQTIFPDNKACASSIITSLLDVRDQSIETKEVEQAVDGVLSSIIEAIGLEEFWAVMQSQEAKPTKDADNGLRYWWSLPLIKVSGSGTVSKPTHFSFFQSKILPLARQCDLLANNQENVKEASMQRNRVEDIWALFPCFCQCPADLESTFPSLIPVLLKAMNDGRYPGILTSISKGFSSLATNVYERYSSLEEEINDENDRQFRKDYAVLSAQCQKLIPSLFKLVDSLHSRNPTSSVSRIENMNNQQSVEEVAQAISSLSRLATTDLIGNLFKKVLQKLLEAAQSQTDQTEKVYSLLCLSKALVVSKALSEDNVTLLYRCIKPIIRTDATSPRVQKRAYKVFYQLCHTYKDFFLEASRLKDVCEILTSSSGASQVSARHIRLKCLACIIDGMDDANDMHMETISQLLSEVILCLKDFNGKTRDAAYTVLLSMAQVKGDSVEFIKLVSASLGAESSHMRSAGLMALSRLIFESAKDDESVRAILPSLLQTVLVLFDDPAREVVKSVVGFVRVVVVAMPPESLEPILPLLAPSLLKYNRGKDRFRAKIKIILKKLVKLFGYEKLFPLISDGDSRLLTHMRKLSEREARRKARRVQEIGGKSDVFDHLLDSDEDDSDDGMTLMTSFTRQTRKTRATDLSAGTKSMVSAGKRGKRSFAGSVASTRKDGTAATVLVKKDSSGDGYDVANIATKTVRFSDNLDDNDSDDGGLEFDVDGKLVVREEVAMPDANQQNDGNSKQSAYPKTMTSKFEAAKQSTAQKKQKRNINSLGAAYKSKKAGGDVKKKNHKFEPYAFVPLDGKKFTKHNRQKAVQEMSTVVRRNSKRQKR